jgi:hypothetical protein
MQSSQSRTYLPQYFRHSKRVLKRYLQGLVETNGLWLKGMLPHIETTSPRMVHSLTNASMGDMTGEILLELQRTQEIISIHREGDSLLLPGGKLGSSLKTWQCTATFGTKLNHLIFPPPPTDIANEVWETIYTTTADTLGFMILPLGTDNPGETKQDKLTRGLRSLSDPDNMDYTQAGWPILSQIGRGEVLLIFVGKKDPQGLVHPSMEMYGIMKKSDWGDLTTPLDVQRRMEAKWHVRVSKQSCKQANRLIVWGVSSTTKKNSRFFLFFFLQKNLKNMI